MRDTRTASQLIETVHELDRLGFAPGSTGNVSVRLTANRFAITPTGVPYRALAPEHIVVVDADGEVVEGELQPSSDTLMHMAVYRARGDAGAVLHCHPPAATTLACLGWALPPVHYMAASLAPNGRVEVAPYATYGTEAAARNAVAAIGATGRACLLANHGVLCLGGDAEQVLSRTVTLDAVAAVYQGARALVPRPPQLAEDQVGEVARKLDRYGRENRARLGRDGEVPVP